MIMRYAALSAMVGLLAFLGLNLAWGPVGLAAHRDLVVRRDRMRENAAELTAIGENLDDSIYALQTSIDAVRLRARLLGYVGPGEGIIRIDGYAPPEVPLTPGSIVLSPATPEDPTMQLRAVSVVVALLTFLILISLGSEIRRRTDRRRTTTTADNQSH